MTSDIEQATELVAAAGQITVFTGAGISTDSGIPDFRGPNGLWTRDPSAQRLVDFDSYRSDRLIREQSWRRRATHPAFAAPPNSGHRCLVELRDRGQLRAVLTQNIDGLHQAAGLSPDEVLELHGTLHESECLGCGERRPIGEALDRVRVGVADPPCLSCGGVLKSATIFFGQQLDGAVFERAAEAAVNCDLFLAIGSSLRVQPAAGLVGLAARTGVPIVLLNAEPTPYDELAAVVIQAPIGTALPAIIGTRGGGAQAMDGPGFVG